MIQNLKQRMETILLKMSSTKEERDCLTVTNKNEGCQSIFGVSVYSC